jgi:hypothetical protein
VALIQFISFVSGGQSNQLQLGGPVLITTFQVVENNAYNACDHASQRLLPATHQVAANQSRTLQCQPVVPMVTGWHQTHQDLANAPPCLQLTHSEANMCHPPAATQIRRLWQRSHLQQKAIATCSRRCCVYRLCIGLTCSIVNLKLLEHLRKGSNMQDSLLACEHRQPLGHSHDSHKHGCATAAGLLLVTKATGLAVQSSECVSGWPIMLALAWCCS